MLNEYNLSFNSPHNLQFIANALTLSWISMTNRIELSGIIFKCLYGLLACTLTVFMPFVPGDLTVPKPRDRFLHTSRVSENRNSTKESPRPLSVSDNSVTSHRDTKLRWDETKWGCNKIRN